MTLLDQIRSNFSGLWTLIEALLCIYKGQICPILKLCGPSLTFFIESVKLWCPIHLGKGMLKEAKTRWRKEGFCRNFIISNSNLGRIWPSLSQFWAKPNNPKHFFCYQQACKGSKSTKNTPVWPYQANELRFLWKFVTWKIRKFRKFDFWDTFSAKTDVFIDFF